uniref:HTH La-type RNA-binding domain-containing protein n=1 Tax=Dicyema japonicum TaxID=399803 RepID=B9ZYX8_DICJA|nr:hypothetical protein [Dicyema japonicum]
MSEETDKMTRIRLQMEYYFSDGNLARDRYMSSITNSAGYVEISNILHFYKMVKLNAKFDDVVQAVKESSFIELDGSETRVRAKELCFVVQLRIAEDIKDEYTLWDRILAPSGISKDMIKACKVSDDTWELFINDWRTSIGCVALLKDYGAKMRNMMTPLWKLSGKTESEATDTESTHSVQPPPPQPVPAHVQFYCHPMYFPAFQLVRHVGRPLYPRMFQDMRAVPRLMEYPNLRYPPQQEADPVYGPASMAEHIEHSRCERRGNRRRSQGGFRKAHL